MKPSAATAIHLNEMSLKRIALLFCLAASSCGPAGNPGPVGPGPDPVTPKDSAEVSEKVPFKVLAKETPDAEYVEYEANTVHTLDGFTIAAAPSTDKYGGWKVAEYAATGYFRVEKSDGRWYLITPEGHPMLSAQVGNFVTGGSERQTARFASLFKTSVAWAQYESKRFREKGFTGFAGSSSTLLELPSSQKIPYCIFFSPMTAYNAQFRKTCASFTAKMPVVFDEGFDAELEKEALWLEKYANDPYCVGITFDDELIWDDSMLQKYLSITPSNNVNRASAQAWLDERKGKTGAAISDATVEDKKVFVVYCLDIYLQKCLAAIRKVDSNHLFMGTRFFSWDRELSNRDFFVTAGKYIDLLSINHFSKWEPNQSDLSEWSDWSGRPLAITSFDIKGEDSGLPNTCGAGWIVPTQKDRGLFYENFVLGLVKSGNCVLWQWYTYQDNDPEDGTADPSNKDANKGIVKWDFTMYDDMVSYMEEINSQLYNLCEYYK